VPGVKTNERPGTRAVLRHSRVSAYKVRQVLDLIRGQDVDRADETLALSDREAARVVRKLLSSAVANAVHNDQLDAEDLYVSACYADEGGTLKRWRPRARGRATRIRKRTSHVTVIVSRMPDDRIARRRAQRAAATSQRARRVAGSRRRQARAEAAGAARDEAGRAGPEAEVVDETFDADELDAEELDAEELDAEELDAEEEAGRSGAERHPEEKGGAAAEGGADGEEER